MLVEGVYECAFYRGLPTLLGAEDDGYTSYDYACLAAFDASPKQTLVQA